MWEGKRFLHKGPGAEVFIQTTPGGGGFGDPLARDPERVVADIAEGIVSVQAAATIYGVVVASDGSADAGATTEQRTAVRAARIQHAQLAATAAA
jgi:N-methylhydantoinase B